MEVNVNHSEQREKDVQELCKKVINIIPNYYETTCPFCYEMEIIGYGNKQTEMSKIKHKPDCAYLIAKDLSANTNH